MFDSQEYGMYQYIHETNDAMWLGRCVEVHALWSGFRMFIEKFFSATFLLRHRLVLFIRALSSCVASTP